MYELIRTLISLLSQVKVTRLRGTFYKLKPPWDLRWARFSSSLRRRGRFTREVTTG